MGIVTVAVPDIVIPTTPAELVASAHVTIRSGKWSGSPIAIILSHHSITASPLNKHSRGRNKHAIWISCSSMKDAPNPADHTREALPPFARIEKTEKEAIVQGKRS